MQHLPSKVPFREDINGLRAWAVIAVVFYHLPLSYHLPGGFVGVDIFFVISGFLMTSIILGGNNNGRFSLGKFYMSRVRRILPALLLVVIVLLSMGWFFLTTPDYQKLSQEAAAALAFISNIHYWDHSGYFDTSAFDKWLLHTWTLGVEAQFYFLYPLFLLTVRAFSSSIKILWIMVLLGFLSSLLLNIVVVHFYPIPTFFLLPSRCWELLAGGLVYLTPRLWPAIRPYQDSKLLFYLAWALILSSMILLNETVLWPGYWALLPVTGASLLIFINNQQSLLTKNIVFQWLGERSYSLYLWHWPAIVLLYFMSLESNTAVIGFVLLATVIVAHCSYQFIETPTRKIFSGLSLKREVTVIFSITVILILAALYLSSHKVQGRIDARVEAIAFQSENKNRFECEKLASFNPDMPGCVYGDRENIGAIVVGDSHSTAQVTAVAEAAAEHGMGVAHYYHDSCPTLSGVKLADWLQIYPSDKCANFVTWLKSELNAYPEAIPLIVINRFSFIFGSIIDKKPAVYFDTYHQSSDDPLFIREVSHAFVDTYCDFSEDRPLFVMKPTPEQRHNVAKEASRQLLFYGEMRNYAISVADYHDKNDIVLRALSRASTQCDVTLLDPIPYLCDNDVCPGMIDGLPIVTDEDHFNEHGNKLLIPMFNKVFEAQ